MTRKKSPSSTQSSSASGMIVLKALRVQCESGEFHFKGETFYITKEDDLYVLRWDSDPDLFGIGQSIEEAIIDLGLTIDAILSLRDRDDLTDELRDFISRLEQYKVR